MRTTDIADYRIIDELGWTIPKEFIAVVEIEDDESSACTDYEQIQTDDYVNVALDMLYGNVKPEYANQDWHLRTLEMLNDVIDKDAGWGEDEIREAVKEWVDSINSSIEHDAEEGFEARQSGDYWEGEY